MNHTPGMLPQKIRNDKSIKSRVSLIGLPHFVEKILRDFCIFQGIHEKSFIKNESTIATDTDIVTNKKQEDRELIAKDSGGKEVYKSVANGIKKIKTILPDGSRDIKEESQDKKEKLIPIQKKRSKEQLKAYIDFKIVCRTRGYKEAFTDDVLQMFQDYGLLQD